MRTKKFLTALSAAAIALAGTFAVAAPANAANLTLTASFSGQIVANSPSPQVSLSVASFTPSGAGFDQLVVSFGPVMALPDWIWNSTCSTTPNVVNCGISSVTIGGQSVTPTSLSFLAATRVLSINLPAVITATGAVTVSLSAGALTTPAAGTSYAKLDFMKNNGGSDSATSSAITVNAAAANQTVTFDANGGSGTMADQVASSATALTANAFTNSGYTFGGWATSQANATAGTVAYADGASFPFTSSQTLYAIWTSNGGSSNATTASLTLNLNVGQPVAGAPVDLSVTGMQANAAWDATVRSTPQSIGSGNVNSSGALTQTVNLPSNLEAGWHSITFTSTDANGNAFTTTTYFEVSATGTLLATSSTIPAALANTGAEAALPLGTAAMLLVVGAALMVMRRRASAA